MRLYQDLESRGLVHACTNEEEVKRIVAQKGAVFYCGFDPTAESLHLGSFLVMMVMRRMQRSGLRPIIVLGGATGMLGDPSGKRKERKLLDKKRLNYNLRMLKRQLKVFFSRGDGLPRPIVVNNAQWTKKIKLIEFLRDIGKLFPVSEMLKKESVNQRLHEEGISFTEFSYVLLQSNDFLELHDRYGCELQIGGSDQWGNITAGIKLIRRKKGGKAFGLTVPLLLDEHGNKFGKSSETVEEKTTAVRSEEEKALSSTIWLNRSMTTPYHMYQYLIRTSDKVVLSHLKMLTLISLEEIEEIGLAHERSPEKREAQKRLAFEVVKTIHGVKTAESVAWASEVIYGGSLESLSKSDFKKLSASVPKTLLKRARVKGEGMDLSALLVEAGLSRSRSEARKEIKSGGISLNNTRITDPTIKISAGLFFHSKYLLLGKGKNRKLAMLGWKSAPGIAKCGLNYGQRQGKGVRAMITRLMTSLTS